MTAPITESCWNTRGTFGNGDCPDLAGNIHCRNCRVYAEAGRSLLDRMSAPDYLGEWGTLIAREKERDESKRAPVLIFRLAMEWLALPVAVAKEVTHLRTIHRLPHRANGIVLGIANVRGGLHLCISLRALLGIVEEDVHPENERKATPRLLVVERDRERWVFPVDEVHGVHRVGEHERQDVPVSIDKAKTYTREMFPWRDKTVGLLDDDLLFCAMRKSIH